MKQQRWGSPKKAALSLFNYSIVRPGSGKKDTYSKRMELLQSRQFFLHSLYPHLQMYRKKGGRRVGIRQKTCKCNQRFIIRLVEPTYVSKRCYLWALPLCPWHKDTDFLKRCFSLNNISTVMEYIILTWKGVCFAEKVALKPFCPSMCFLVCALTDKRRSERLLRAQIRKLVKLNC